MYTIYYPGHLTCTWLISAAAVVYIQYNIIMLDIHCVVQSCHIIFVHGQCITVGLAWAKYTSCFNHSHLPERWKIQPGHREKERERERVTLFVLKWVTSLVSTILTLLSGHTGELHVAYWLATYNVMCIDELKYYQDI